MKHITSPEVFKLGMAFALFGVGDIDAGVHCILPVRDVDTGMHSNAVFNSLCDQFLIEVCKTGEDYLKEIVVWIVQHGLEEHVPPNILGWKEVMND